MSISTALINLFLLSRLLVQEFHFSELILRKNYKREANKNMWVRILITGKYNEAWESH